MDTKTLRYFCACYETGSLNKASERFYISPQGMGKNLNRLEDELGVVLFRRSSAGLIPTKSGDYLYRHSRELLYRLQDLEMEMKRMDFSRRSLRVGFACGVIRALQSVPALRTLNQKLIGSESVEWTEDFNQNIKDLLLGGKIDTAYVVDHFRSPMVHEQKIFETRLCAVVPQGHPLYDRDVLSFVDLQEEKLITLNEKFSIFHSIVTKCQELGFVPQISIRTMESSLIYLFVARQHGIGIDVNLHASEIRQENIRCIEIKDSIPWAIYAATLKTPASSESAGSSGF